MALFDLNPIHLLEADPNRRGDLLVRLVRDLFFAMGYEDLRLNVPKTGREIDLTGRHRYESDRYVRVECKATTAAIGGDQINKFYGLLDGERRILQKQDPTASVAGHYISLAGFKDSALTQEDDFGRERLNLMDGAELVEAMTRAALIVPKLTAVDAASRLLGPDSQSRLLDIALLVHPIGVAWALRYHDSHVPASLILVHADGRVLSIPAAAPFIDAASQMGLSEFSLPYLAKHENELVEQIRKATAAYRRYLNAACGTIQMDGLPADEHVGAKRIPLENLFVPLHLSEVQSPVSDSEGSASPAIELSIFPSPRKKRRNPKALSQNRVPAIQVLAEHRHIAVLGAPGAGKSTLLKWIAMSYAYGQNKLGNQPASMMPFYILCRDLGALVREPIREILVKLADRAELTRDLRVGFEAFVEQSILSGSALLLVDGLDEIADQGNRISFVTALRTFLSIYPQVSLVVTSREAGFRSVAPAIAYQCARFSIADFDPRDIRSLVRSWHREVYGDSPVARRAAKQLADNIIKNDRIRSLVANPLLLTTLLLVNRWVGQLPSKRTALYEKAIDVLLMTWNTQAHEPIPLDEALPRLEYVAYVMLEKGMQRISYGRLKSILSDARAEMPEVLEFAQFGDTEFLQRVELRSSLLVQTGHIVEDGIVAPVYEFRHLTFQEYLVARAIVSGHYPERSEADTPTSRLMPHLGEQAWSEVIPMTAVLASRGARSLVSALIQEAGSGTDTKRRGMVALLIQCLLDEVQLGMDDLDLAIRTIVASEDPESGPRTLLERSLRTLSTGKYGRRLTEVVRLDYHSLSGPQARVARALTVLTLATLGWSDSNIVSAKLNLDTLMKLSQSDDPDQQAAAALVWTRLLGSTAPAHYELKAFALADYFLNQIRSEFSHVRYSHAALLEKMAVLGWRPHPSLISGLIAHVARDYRAYQDSEAKLVLCSLVLNLPVLRPDLHPLPEEFQAYRKELLEVSDDSADSERDRALAAVLGFYSLVPVVPELLVDELQEFAVADFREGANWAATMLIHLGPKGADLLHELEARAWMIESMRWDPDDGDAFLDIDDEEEDEEEE